MTPPVIVWFRRDLRLCDHLALARALESGQRVLPLFILDPSLLRGERTGVPRLQFMLSALENLDASLREYGRGLLVRRGDPLTVLREIIEQTSASALFFNADYTPFARQRDSRIVDHAGVPVHVFDDRLLVHPDDIRTGAGGVYTVFTPFMKKWRDLPKTVESPLVYSLTADHLYDISELSNAGVPSLDALGFQSVIPTPSASEYVAHDLLDGFAARKIYAYSERRNLLANPFDDPRNGTSSLSPYVRFGLLSLRQIRSAAVDAYRSAPSDSARESVNAWVNEIIWHEFYTHILWHFPHVTRDNFNPKYDVVEWRHAPNELRQWQAGQTGFPVVDAAMRQLRETGWMHNRARMIVSSFLTKDLLIDWREGERYFMQWLIDGDLAANNGGWQWAAGTGTDAQPYFRIFNPVSQSKKFDPDGVFIRHWIPELRDVPDKYIHEPHRAPRPPREYPPPMVDHAMARERALIAFSAAKVPDQAGGALRKR